MLRQRDNSSAVAEFEFTDGTAVVRLLGDLADKKPDRLIFDMAAVGFLDCSAVGVMFAAARSMLPGRKPVIRPPGPLVRRLLELSGLNRQKNRASRRPDGRQLGRARTIGDQQGRGDLAGIS